jgi:hypothetical protein
MMIDKLYEAKSILKSGGFEVVNNNGRLEARMILEEDIQTKPQFVRTKHIRRGIV